MPSELPLPLVDAALRGAVFAWLLLLAAQLARARGPQSPAARAALWLCLGLAVQVPGSAPWAESHLGCAWHTPLVAISVGNGVLFWLFTAALFDDGFRWRAWHAAAWGMAALIGGAQCAAMTQLEPGWLQQAARVALRGVTLLSLLAALWVALRHWRADLVEARRRLRLWLVAAGIVYTAVQLTARLSTPVGLLTPSLALLDVAVLGSVIGAWALSTLRLRTDGLLELAGDAAVPPATSRADLPVAADAPRRAALATGMPPRATEPRLADSPPAVAVPTTPTGPAASSAPADPTGAAGANTADSSGSSTDRADDALAAALRQAMEVDRAYRDDGLTVASLAARLGVPEYRLRRHINQRLGFRNFNAFVNGFRLADARRWLADPAHGEAPVLTIALDAGFGSIGPFNRAFKADTGLTPTEFRAQALARHARSGWAVP